MKTRHPASSAKKRRKQKLPIPLFVFFGIIIMFIMFASIYKLTTFLVGKSSDATVSKMEIILNEVTIETIDSQGKNTIYPNNTVSFIQNSSSTAYDDVEIKGRGNSTWDEPKKPYQLKFSQKESLFNLPKSKKWILLANYLDPTMLRNDSAFYISRLIRAPINISGNFTELYIDDNYRGLYYIAEKIELSKSKINLSDPNGILLELDNVYGPLEDHYKYNGVDYLVIKDSVNKDNNNSSLERFVDAINLLAKAIDSSDYESISNIIDIDSFAKYYLLNEFTVNPDAYSTSFYLYKDGSDGKIFAGPGWDFDLAFGNKAWSASWADLDTFYSPSETEVLRNHQTATLKDHQFTISTLLYDLMDIPEFTQRVKEIYQSTLSGKGEELLDYIKSRAEYIRPATLRDQARWKSKTDFDKEVDYLIDWVAKRYSHFEETYGTNSNPDPALESPQPSIE